VQTNFRPKLPGGFQHLILTGGTREGPANFLDHLESGSVDFHDLIFDSRRRPRYHNFAAAPVGPNTRPAACFRASHNVLLLRLESSRKNSMWRSISVPRRATVCKNPAFRRSRKMYDSQRSTNVDKVYVFADIYSRIRLKQFQRLLVEHAYRCLTRIPPLVTSHAALLSFFFSRLSFFLCCCFYLFLLLSLLFCIAIDKVLRPSREKLSSF